MIATLVGILVVFAIVLARVALLQGSSGDDLRSVGAEQWGRTRVLPAQRGAIFDRNGDELALSVPAATVVVNPLQITDPAGTASVLAQLLDLDADHQATLAAAITSDAAQHIGFRYVARQIDPAIARQIDELDMTGVSTYSEDRRMMPGGSTGQSVIGRTDIDGVGSAGLELQYNDLLQGSPGRETLEVAPGGRSIAGSEQTIVAPQPGVDIITTIDRSVQYSAEQALLRRVNETGAKGGQLVVMSVDGDILAMASVDRNSAGAAVVTSGNFSAVDAYEPGSVGKIITVAGALEDGAVTPDRYFTVPWQYDCTNDTSNGILSDSHQHDVEQLSVHDIIVESSNVGTILMGKELTYAREDHYLRSFGLGQVSALHFPGESQGILKPWQEWEGTERCTIFYGQGVSSTPVQLTAAVNAIANGGVYVAPRLVSGYVGGDGEVTDASAPESHRVVSAATASEVAGILHDVVCADNGTANAAAVPGVSVAGKTGTAYKAQPDGTYFNAQGKHTYYTSFVGFFPTEDPQVTVLVSIDEPPTGTSGGQAAAPVFSQIVPTIMNEMSIQPPAGSTGCDG